MDLIVEGLKVEDYKEKALAIIDKYQSIRVIGTNQNIGKAVNLVEIVKHLREGLHQSNMFDHLDNFKNSRVLITLSEEPLDVSSPGYQPPIGYRSAPPDAKTKNKKMPPEASKYKLVPPPSLVIAPNCVVVNTKKPPFCFVEKAIQLFADGADSVILRNGDCNPGRVAKISEMVMDKENGLFCLTEHGIRTIEKRYVPLEEGLDEVVRTDEIKEVFITLSKTQIHSINHE